MNVTRRPESPQDDAFLRRLISETVTQELGAAAWPQPMRDHLVGLQEKVRRQTIRSTYPDAESQIIVVDGVEAGWVVVASLPGEMRLVEIMVLAEYRGKGVGSAVIREIMAVADHGGKKVRLGVNAMNPGAIRLYERLGFRRIGGDEIQHEMERAAPSSA